MYHPAIIMIIIIIFQVIALFLRTLQSCSQLPAHILSQ